MKNEAEEPGDDSQNEKTVVDKSAEKHPKKATKPPGFVDTDSDDTNQEQERVVKKLQKAPKPHGFVDTNSSTEDEQGSTVKQPQKTSKILGCPSNEDP